MTERYSRQILFPAIGEAGQRRLAQSNVVLIGCGALGTVMATSLVRAGVGRMSIIDRDFIEYHNLQRQVIFDEDDIKNQLPKAIAAERHLKRVNSSVKIEGIVADVNYTNIERLVRGADIILDGLDNLEARLLINDVALKYNIPWVYGGAIASLGMMMTVIPQQTPCFRCIVPGAVRGTVLTCDTAGVISPAPTIIAALQTVAAMKILVGSEDINSGLITIDVWQGTFQHLKTSRRRDCPACQGQYEFLDGRAGEKTSVLCGQNSVQVLNPNSERLSLAELAAQLRPLGEVSYNEFMLHFMVDGHEMFVFPDGRAIIKNTEDESLARGLYAKYIGT